MRSTIALPRWIFTNLWYEDQGYVTCFITELLPSAVWASWGAVCGHCFLLYHLSFLKGEVLCCPLHSSLTDNTFYRFSLNSILHYFSYILSFYDEHRKSFFPMKWVTDHNHLVLTSSWELIWRFLNISLWSHWQFVSNLDFLYHP